MGRRVTSFILNKHSGVATLNSDFFNALVLENLIQGGS
jgi:hypothetical protein